MSEAATASTHVNNILDNMRRSALRSSAGIAVSARWERAVTAA